MPTPTMWVIYGILLALVALLGPAILERYGGRAFIACAVVGWLSATAVLYAPVFSPTFWASHLGEASADFAALAIGFGIPIWGGCNLHLDLKPAPRKSIAATPRRSRGRGTADSVLISGRIRRFSRLDRSRFGYSLRNPSTAWRGRVA
jgi:hypothetical protein